jgi:tetratricopeptide (TPR) repeat protein
LAQHYTEAALLRRAVEYWLLAGTRASRQSATREAISHLRRVLALVDRLPEPASRASLELQLQAAIGPALIAVKGLGDHEVGQVYARAGEISAQLGDGPHLFPVLWGQWVYYLVKDDLQKARSLSLEMKRLGEQSGDSAMLIEAHWTLGNTLFWLCELKESGANLERAIELYEPQKHHANAYIYGQDPAVAAYCYAGYTYFALGFPEKAAAAQQTCWERDRLRGLIIFLPKIRLPANRKQQTSHGSDGAGGNDDDCDPDLLFQSDALSTAIHLREFIEISFACSPF